MLSNWTALNYLFDKATVIDITFLKYGNVDCRLLIESNLDPQNINNPWQFPYQLTSGYINIWLQSSE